MIGITGRRSVVTEKFLKLLDSEEVRFGSTSDLPLDCEQYLLAAGVLHGKNLSEISEEEAVETFLVNYFEVVQFCDRVFEVNTRARICIIGSESGFKGSYDTVYAGTKAALHLYIETKKLMHPTQHLVGVAPTVIEDAGMTQRRKDLQETLEKGKGRRLGRWLQSAEVAKVAAFALGEDSLCNSIIRMRGGNW